MPSDANKPADAHALAQLAARIDAALSASIGGASLLHGPAGCGKTRLVDALGRRLSWPIVRVSVERVCRPRIGGAEAALHAELDAARARAPCVLIIDELHALAPANALPGSMESRLALQVADALQEMRASAVYTVGVCREPEALHAAVRRSGRLHHQLGLRAPSPAERSAILESLAEQLLPSGEAGDRMRATVRAVGADAHGLCGAQLAGLCQHAATAAWRRERAAAEAAEVSEAATKAAEAASKAAEAADAAAKAKARAAAAPVLALSPAAKIDAKTFQKQWESLPTAATWSAVVGGSGVVEGLKDRLAAKHVKCMASGAQADVSKFYLYAVEATTSCLVLVELQVAWPLGQASTVIKGDPNSAAVIAPLSALLLAELTCEQVVAEEPRDEEQHERPAEVGEAHGAEAGGLSVPLGRPSEAEWWAVMHERPIDPLAYGCLSHCPRSPPSSSGGLPCMQRDRVL